MELRWLIILPGEDLLNSLVENKQRLRSCLEDIPNLPGCYLMMDNQGSVLYIGKSKNLQKRVKSYFQKSLDHTPRILLMIRKIYDIQLIITDNESEALTLESNLIKSHQPYFNVLLKDDKKYPYICITWSEKYPRIYITRKRRLNHEDKYYGPFVDVNLLRNTLFWIKTVFPLRQRPTALYKDRTCLNYSINRCPGVCQEKIEAEEYRTIIKKVEMIFQGRSNQLRSLLEAKMNKYSEELEYERALIIRDQLKGLEKIGESQKVSLPNSLISIDIVAMEIDKTICSIQIFQMRSGNLVGRLGYIWRINNENPNHIQTRILEEHYSRVDMVEIPSEIVTQYIIKDNELITEWLKSIRGKNVKLTTPIKGKKFELIQLVRKNAQLELERIKKGQEKHLLALEDLAQALDLNVIPRRIEGFDISHISGSDAVGSQVVFIDGMPAKHQYRKYKIRSEEVIVGHSDDYLSIAEVLRRRFKRWSEFKKQGGKIEDLRHIHTSVLDTISINDWPDLIMIDGGKGQLNKAIEVFEEIDLIDDISICSLAKNREEIFIPNNKHSLDTEINDPAVIMLRRVRDEAHRFAVTFHKQLRTKRMTRSQLSNIEGLGSKRIRDLLSYFNSVEAIQHASIDELCKVDGFGIKTSRLVWKYFHD